MRKRRAVVVGAGPAGSSAALSLLDSNQFEVLLLDKLTLAEKRKPCGGGLGPAALRHLRARGLEAKILAQAYPIRGARFHTPKGRHAVVEGASVAAAVLPRHRLDALLATEASRAGAELVEQWPVTGLLEHGDTVMGVRGPYGEVEADLVIVAAGGTTSLARRQATRLQCIWQPVEGARYDPGVLEIVVTHKISPWYAWLFPEGDGRANVGLCCLASELRRTELQETFEQICQEQLGPALKGASLGAPQFKAIHTSRWPHPANRPHLWVVGEAAALANEATGEGIAQALISGRLAGQAAARWGDLGEERAGRLYEQKLRWALGPGLGASPVIETLIVKRLLGALPALTSGGLSAWLSRAMARTLAA